MEEHRLVQGMVLLRMLSACIEVAAVVMMLRLEHLAAVFRLNAMLGLVGPAIFLLVSALGLAGMAGRLSPGRLLLLGLGVGLILWGSRQGG